MLRKLKAKKMNWKKGSAELVGVAFTLPLMCIILIVVVGVMQSGVMRMTMEHTAYASARAACTSRDYSTAQSQAYSTALSTLKNGSFGIDESNLQVKVDLVAGTTTTGVNPQSSNNGIEWEKGALMRLYIEAPYYSLATFSERTMKTELYVMVEQPAKTYYD